MHCQQEAPWTTLLHTNTGNRIGIEENIVIWFRQLDKAVDILDTRGCNNIAVLDYHHVPTRNAV